MVHFWFGLWSNLKTIKKASSMCVVGWQFALTVLINQKYPSFQIIGKLSRSYGRQHWKIPQVWFVLLDKYVGNFYSLYLISFMYVEFLDFSFNCLVGWISLYLMSISQFTISLALSPLCTEDVLPSA